MTILHSRVLAVKKIALVFGVLLLSSFLALAATAETTTPGGAAGGNVAPSASSPQPPASGSAAPFPPTIDAVVPTDVVRGSVLTVSGKGFGTKPEQLDIALGDISLGHPLRATDTAFSVAVPETIVAAGGSSRPFPLGKSLLRITLRTADGVSVTGMPANPYSTGQVEVHADPGQAPRLDKVVPPAAFAGGLERITLVGANLPRNERDVTLVVDGVERSLCSGGECSVRASFSDHELVLTCVADKQNPHGSKLSAWLGLGQHHFAIRSGNFDATPAVDFQITNYDSGSIRGGAAVLAFTLLGVIAWLARLGTYKKDARGLMRAFLFDAETESFSLGKLQFFLWTIAALLAYCYLMLARFLVQQAFQLPDVPDGLVPMLGISGGTAAFSVGLTAAKGPKGAGTAEASFSDLVSVGGVVSPERFQFLLWTFVAVLAFLGATIALDPLQINTLPAVPSTLLALSGVSAGSYVAGKIARPPGPVISDVLSRSGSLVLTIMGRNLDRFARFEINGTNVIAALPAQNADGSTPYRPRVLEPETGDRSQDLSKSLELVLARFDPAWLANRPKPMLTIINQDGQRADYELNVEPAIWKAFTAASVAVETVPATPAPALSSLTSPPEASPDQGQPVDDNTSHRVDDTKET